MRRVLRSTLIPPRQLHEIRRGAYYDSVVLMQLQRGLVGLDGVQDAGVVMATPANCELLSANNLLPDAINPSPDDLLIVIKAHDEQSFFAREFF